MVPARTDEVSGNEDVQTKLQMPAAFQEQAADPYDLLAFHLQRLKSPERNLLSFPALSLARPLKL